ncbi:Ig-like domain-containing protein, partial [Vibrio sp. S12_S33]|uniref:Ig-like domain-containing protein n=1 Tax=Vibrio sp. S12_S33 TaxID=2720223 RepID=UPI00192D25D5
MNIIVSVSESGVVTQGLSQKEEGTVYLVFDESGTLVASAVYEDSSERESLADYVSLDQKESIEQLIIDGLDPTLFEELAPASGETLSSSIGEVFTLNFGDVDFPSVSTFFETSPILLFPNLERSDDLLVTGITISSDTLPTLTIVNAADGSVNATENNRGVEINVTLPTGVKEGDTVTLTITNPDGSETEQTYTVTAADLSNGSSNITIPALTADGTYSVTTQISDSLGNTTAESAPVTFDLDTTIPGDTDGDGVSDTAPTLTIADAADGSVSVAENSDGFETNVTLPTGVE